MTPATPKKPGKDAEPFLEKFRSFKSELNEPAWLWPLRQAGMTRFTEAWLPDVAG